MKRTQNDITVCIEAQCTVAVFSGQKTATYIHTIQHAVHSSGSD